MIGQRELTMEDGKALLRRHKWLLIIPAVVLSIGAYVISMFLAPRYKSEAVILVDAPAVPADIVKPIVGGDVNQRLATMQEEILSRTRLQQIIEKFNLYKEDVGRRPMEELVSRLRSSIDVSAVRPMAETHANGLPGFTIEVTANRPSLAQQVCTEILSMFLQQSVVFRQRKADDTTEFLNKQLQEAKDKLNEQDEKLAAFQRRNMGALPDEAQTNFSLLTGLASELDAVTQALNRAQQDKVFVESSLSQQIAAAKLSPVGENPENPLSRQLAALEDHLASLRIRYTENHPDVIKAKNEIAQLQRRIQEEAEASSQATNNPNKPVMTAEGPQVQELRAQLHQIDMTIRERMADQSRLQQQISRVQARLELTPAVAQEYKALTRDYQTALGIYNDLLKKQSDTEMSRDLERRQEGEQFRMLDPPSLPQSPTFPNRRLFAFSGLAGGLCLGLAIAFLLEAQDTTLRTDKDVEHVLKLPTLAVIPAIKASRESGSNGSTKKIPEQEEEPVNSSVGV